MTSAAPLTLEQIQATAIRGVEFLYNKLPLDPNPPTALDLRKRKYEPSSLDVSKFERYMEAVFNPMTVVKDLSEGTITREQVEALSAVYPEIYKEVQSQVMEQVTEHADDMPYSKRLQLGILLDIPTDQSLQSANIQGLQASYNQNQQGDQQQPGDATAVNTTQGGLENIEFSQNSQTPTQRAQNR
jgi:hypothetical protein